MATLAPAVKFEGTEEPAGTEEASVKTSSTPVTVEGTVEETPQTKYYWGS